MRWIARRRRGAQAVDGRGGRHLVHREYQLAVDLLKRVTADADEAGRQTPGPEYGLPADEEIVLLPREPVARGYGSDLLQRRDVE